MGKPAEDWFPRVVATTIGWGAWIDHDGGERPAFVRVNDFDLSKPADAVVYVARGSSGWGRNWSPPWSDIEWYRLRADHPFYAYLNSAS